MTACFVFRIHLDDKMSYSTFKSVGPSTTDLIAMVTAECPLCQNSCRFNIASHPAAKEKVVKELRSFKPGLIISSGMNLTHCLSAGKGLKIPVIFLSLQVMIPSNYCPALGLLPRLPSFLNMNWFAWKLVMTYLIKKGREGFLPIFSEQLGVPEKELQVDYHEFCDHCSCQAKFPILFAVSEAFHGKLPPEPGKKN